MEQTDNSNYRTQESLQHKFTHSCLGRLAIFGIFVIILLIIAYYTAPTADVMYEEMMDNIAQCISENDSIKTDEVDDAVNNVSFIFTTADSAKLNKEEMAAFEKYNKLECYQHTFYSTARLTTNFRPEGIRVGVGLFGVVIPTVNYKDIILNVGPVHKGYNQKIRTITKDPYYGKSPDIQEYHYQRDRRD